MKTLCLLLLLTIPAFAQEAQPPQTSERPRIDRWRGLIIDESTPDDAIGILGKPKKDLIDRINIVAIDSRVIAQRQKQKIFRTFEYESAEDMRRFELAFENNKLVMISLLLKSEVKAAALENIYGVTFRPWYRQITQFFSGDKLKRDNGTVYAKQFPSMYGLVSTGETTLFGAHIQNTSFWSVPGDAAYPGKVQVIQIISRTLENRDGADVLK